MVCDGVWKMVCDKVVCERCDKWGVRSGAAMSCAVISEMWEVEAAAGQQQPRAPQLFLEALCTAPATQNTTAAAAARPGGHAKARPERSVYCACHAKRNRGPSGGHARRSSSCVVRLPRKSSSRMLCVLRLPRKTQPRPQRRPRAPQLVVEALCTARATQKLVNNLCALRLPRKTQPRPQRRPRAPQLVLEGLCTAPATQNATAAPAAATRAAARPGGSVYCACHAKARPERSVYFACKTQLRPQRRPRAPRLVLEALCYCAVPAMRDRISEVWEVKLWWVVLW